jgi:hypothetical protein
MNAWKRESEHAVNGQISWAVHMQGIEIVSAEAIGREEDQAWRLGHTSTRECPSGQYANFP